MIEQDLIDLGFKRTDIPAEESGEEAFYYYDLDLAPGFGLISCASNEKTLVVGHYRWSVEVFEIPEVRFVDRKELEEFINIVKRNTKSSE